ncbi:Heme-binding protein 2-like, partial [Scleropages formosus]
AIKPKRVHNYNAICCPWCCVCKEVFLSACQVLCEGLSSVCLRKLGLVICVYLTGVKMDMTAPVLVKVQENKKIWESSKYTLSFLLPSAFQESAPLPTDPKVYFTDMPDTRVYVRSYGGWMLSVTTKLNSEMLTRDLDKVNATYNKNFSYAVGYNSPKKILNRHNEVWYIVDGEPVCSEPTDTVSDTE